MGTLKRLNERLNDLFLLVGGICLVLMMGISCVNMLTRFLGNPMTAAYELVGFLGAIVVSFPLGYAQLKKSHIAVDILSRTFPAGVRKVLVGISLLLAIGFFFLAAWKVADYATTLRVAGELSETLRIRFYPFTYAVAAACGVMTFSLFVDFLLLWTPAEEESK
jgi:TRAP-type C4-dicarboxylate transport system permease small subunit